LAHRVGLPLCACRAIIGTSVPICLPRVAVLIIPIQFPNFFFCFLYHDPPLDALDRKVSLGRA
jgi:hypothetical protein